MGDGKSGKALELRYQAEHASGLADVGPTPAYVVERYRRCRLWRLFVKEFMFRQLGREIAGKTILDFGCGTGEISTQLAKLGARVVGVDISPELIQLCERRALLDSVQTAARFLVADITESPLPENEFDFVICSAVLHHVEIPVVLPLLIRTLKPGGTAILSEPIALSPMLSKVRNLVPVKKDVSPGERQLSRADLDVIGQSFAECKMTYFNVLGRLSRLLPNRNRIDHGHPITKLALIVLNGADRLLLTVLPFLNSFAGTVVIVGQRASQQGEVPRQLHAQRSAPKSKRTLACSSV